MADTLIEHQRQIDQHGEHLPQFGDWKWQPDPLRARSAQPMKPAA